MRTTTELTGGVILIDRGLRKWMAESWTHTLIVYGLIVITLSLVVQIIATVRL